MTLRRGVIAAFLAVLCLAQNAIAQMPDEYGRIDELTNEIVRKEIDFLKLNSNLRLHQLPAPWAGRRWWMFNFAGVALTATGAYINGAGRFSYLHSNRLSKAPKHLFVNAGWCRVTANAIMVGGGLLETAVLALKDRRDKKQGVNLPVMQKYADDLQNELDQLIAKREALVQALPTGSRERELFEAEGQVLSDVRHLSVKEFVRYFADTKGSRAFFYTSYLIAAASNALAGAGGIVGNYAALTTKGTARSRTRLGGTGGIADIISGGMNQSVPIAVRVASHIATKRATKKLCAQLDCKDTVKLEDLHAHQQRYHEMVALRPQLTVTGGIKRDAVYAKTTTLFDDHEKVLHGDAEAKKRRLISQSIFFTGIGTPKLVNGIGTTVGAFKYTTNTQERFRAIGGPAIAYGAGYSVSLAELIRYQLLTEIHSARAKREGRSAGQLIKRDIADLETLSDSLNGTTPMPILPKHEPTPPDSPVE